MSFETSGATSGRMNIVHLNAYDRHGGAEVVANNLIAVQQAAGHQSVALVGHKTDPDSPALAFPLDPDLERRDELYRHGWPDYEYRGSHQLMSHPVVQDADVIHAHNLYGGYFHPLSLIALSQFRPVIWSIHDMQPLTGYCSHALDCPRWQTGCGDCPDLHRPGPHLTFDNTAALWRDKSLIAQNSRLWLVGPSTWMASQISRSLWREHPVHHISNAIDTRLFRPGDRLAARRKLGLPENVLIVGGLARKGILAHPWKGGPYARAVLARLRVSHPDLIFLNLGADGASEESWMRPLASSDPETIREALHALDIFLYPSIADTGPLAVLEAMACGLPVVGFRVGGIPDFVTADAGILVEPLDTEQLAEAALKLAADENLRRSMGAAARVRVVKHFDREQMAQGYENLYRTAIAAHPVKARARVDVSLLAGIQNAQRRIIQLDEKVVSLHQRRSADDIEIRKLLRHYCVRLGLRLRLVRGSLRRWLRLKARENAGRRSE